MRAKITLKYHLLCWHYARCFGIPIIPIAQNYAGIIRTGLITHHHYTKSLNGLHKELIKRISGMQKYEEKIGYQKE